MYSVLRNNWTGILFVAFIYYLAGRLGQLVAIPPGNVTAIWPPSAIALVALLLYGYQLWPGVFLGAFLNSVVSLVSPTIFSATMIGGGAAIQAVFGCWLIQRYIGEENVFKSPYNAVLFLILGTLSCLVNSNIGTAALYISGIINSDIYLTTWWTWWLGDSGSIFVLAPLLLVWHEKYQQKYLTVRSSISAIATLLLLYLTIELAFRGHYPVIYLVIPIIIWAAFEFGLKGATLTVFITSVLTLWYTAQFQGPFILPTPNESLLFLETFLGTLSTTAIILAVVLEQRRKAFELLEQANAGLEVKVNERTAELAKRNVELSQTILQLKGAQKQIVVQEKLATFGSLSGGIVSEIKDPLNFVNNFTDINLDLCNHLEAKLAPLDESKNGVKEDIECLKDNLGKIQKHGKKIGRFLDCLIAHTRGPRGESQVLDLNYVIKEYSLLAYQTLATKDSTFSVKVKTHFDETLDKYEMVPQDFTNALLSLLNNAHYSVRQKQKEKGEQYFPEISITTKNFEDRIEITVHDNGLGIPMKIRDKIFNPFFSTKPSGEGAGLGLTLCRDIIVIGYGGQVKVDSQEGEFADFTIVLPKKTHS